MELGDDGVPKIRVLGFTVGFRAALGRTWSTLGSPLFGNRHNYALG